jgi:hypothetical protein
MTQLREGYRQPGNWDENLPSASICHFEIGRRTAKTLSFASLIHT